MLYVDVPVIAYKTYAISIGIMTEDGFVEDYDAEENFQMSDGVIPYDREHPHVK